MFLATGTSLLGQIPVIALPADGNVFPALSNPEIDSTNPVFTTPGTSAMTLRPFSTSVPRPASVPNLFGGFLFYTQNQSNGDYGPNWFGFLISPESGSGYLNFSVTEIIKTATTGTITNAFSGAFMSPVELGSDPAGEFRVLLRENTINHPQANGGVGEIRGLAYDGTRWLVTADAASNVPAVGVASVTLATAAGWHVLDTATFTFAAASVTPSGPITAAGYWFAFDETSAPTEVGFMFSLANAYFTPRQTPTLYHPDTDLDGQISLSELLSVIELYNTRNGSLRTGRYRPTDEDPNIFATDPTAFPTTPALFATYYAADTNRDGAMALSELLRVIEIYNVRDGTTRVGRYRADADAADGVAPDTGN